MKKLTFLKSLLLATFVFSIGIFESSADTYSHTITAKTWSAYGDQTLNGVTWTASATGGSYWGYDATKGQQFGSAGSPATILSLTTSGITGTITSVKIETSGASGVVATLSVSVGGTSFTCSGNTSVSITATNTAYEFTGSGSGEIIIKWEQTSSKALYLKAIEVTYTTSSTPTPTITVTETSIPAFTTTVENPVTSTIHVSGTNLTANIELEISGTNADQFSVDPASLTPDEEGTVDNTEVTITYTPTSVGNHTATLTLSSEGAADVTRSLSGTAGLAAPVATAATNANKNSFTANWEAVPGAETYEVSVYTKTQGTTTATDLFISEYVEGSSNNKALEIFNGTGADVDLSQYSLKKQTNGEGDYKNEKALSGTLANGDVYVIANTQASDAIKAKANLTEGTITSFNGNDAIGLFKNDMQIDEVGVFNQIEMWGENVTLIRKSSVTSPKVPYDASEWDSYEIDYIANLGTHTMDDFGEILHPITGSPFTVAGTETSKVITGLSPATTYYYKVVAISGEVRSAASNEIAASTLSVGVPSVTLKNISVRDGKIYVTVPVAGQQIEVYNTLGQRIVSIVSVEGQNEISIPTKGIHVVKCGATITKVILP